MVRIKRAVDMFFGGINKYAQWRNIKRFNKKYYKLLRESDISVKRLSSEQKKDIDSIYKKYGFKYTYDTHIFAYSVTGEFHPEIMPEDIFRVSVAPKLNDRQYSNVMSDKGYFELFMPAAKFPECIIKNIDGMFYDKDLNCISMEEAEKLVLANEKVVIKPTRDSGGGKGVTLVDTQTLEKSILKGKNYIVQCPVIQHKSMAELNESSINVIRITTVLLDGNVYAVSSAMLVGTVGEFANNVVTKDGKGLIVVGIDENGRLRDEGYFHCGIKTKTTPGGVVFSGREVYKYNEMVEVAKAQHLRFPYVKFIGWDFAVTSEGEVIVMEYNLKSPGIQHIQYTNGPLFGDLTEKVMDYAKNKK